MEVVGIVEVQPAVGGLLENSPLAGIARRRFGGRTLLEWVVRRVTEADRLLGVVVLAGDDRFSRSLVAQCPPDVRVFHARRTRRAGRLAAAVRSLGCRSVVSRQCLPSRLSIPVLVDGLITAVTSGHTCDYASYSLADGRHAADSKLGVFAEWCRGEAILLADQLARSPAERSDATRFLRTHPEVFARACSPWPGNSIATTCGWRSRTKRTGKTFSSFWTPWGRNRSTGNTSRRSSIGIPRFASGWPCAIGPRRAPASIADCQQRHSAGRHIRARRQGLPEAGPRPMTI